MVSAVFAEVLASRRSEFNARAAEARRRYRGFDHDAFSRFLVNNVDPVVQAVASAAPDRVSGVAGVAYGLALDLAGLRLADPAPRSRSLAGAWRSVIPSFAALLARHPEQVLGTLSNAVLQLDALDGVRTEQWGREMAALASGVESVPQLRALGQVLAWRAGAAHYRRGAIAAAGELPEWLALAAFGAADAVSWQSLCDDMGRNAWWCERR